MESVSRDIRLAWPQDERKPPNRMLDEQPPMLEPMIVLFFGSKLNNKGHHPISVGIRAWYH